MSDDREIALSEDERGLIWGLLTMLIHDNLILPTGDEWTDRAKGVAQDVVNRLGVQTRRY